MAEMEPFRGPCEGACSCCGDFESESQPRNDRDAGSHSFYSNPKTVMTIKEVEPSAPGENKSTQRRNEITFPTTLRKAEDFVYENNQLCQDFARISSIWQPSSSQCNTLSCFITDAPPVLDSRSKFFHENLMQDRAYLPPTIYEPYRMPRNSSDSVICTPASVTLSTMMTAIVTATTVKTTAIMMMDTETTATVKTASVTKAIVSKTTVTTVSAATDTEITTMKRSITKTATTSTVSYAAVTASYIPPRRSEFPKYNDRSLTKSEEKYTIFVEYLPNWNAHLRNLTVILGYPINARSYGRGVQFMLRTLSECKTVQGFLTHLLKIEPAMSSFSYAPSTSLPTKIGIKGLPSGTSISEIRTALRSSGFPVESIQAIPLRGRSECLYIVEIGYLTQNQMAKLFSTQRILNMPGVIIEDLSRTGSLQCYEPFEKSVSRKTTKQKALSYGPPEEKQKGNTQNANKRQKKKGKKGKESVAISRQKEENSPPFSVHTANIKNPVAGQSNVNQFDILAKMSTHDNDPTGCIEIPDKKKSKSKKRREKMKMRRDFLNQLFTSTSTLDIRSEVTETQDEAAPVEIQEEQDSDETEEPLLFYDCFSTPPSDDETTEKKNRSDAAEDLLILIIKLLDEIHRAIDEIDIKMHTIMQAIYNFIEEYYDEE